MKCPKCAYIGFEDTDRCRHCGCEFSLLATETSAFAAAEADAAPEVRAFTPRPREHRLGVVGDLADVSLAADAEGGALMDFPLRSSTFPVLGHDPQPPPARTPLAVRRALADRPRGRTSTELVRRASSPLLDVAPHAVPTTEAGPSEIVVAPAGLRLAAAVIDLLVLAAIDLAVVYLTVQLAGVQIAEVATLPLVPLGAFLLGLNVAYLAVFTASGGQTLGKMAMGLRVIGLAGGFSTGAAILRVGVALLGALVAGAGFLPALARADGRALHDYAAGTRVVKVTL